MAETLNTPALLDSTITRRELLATGAAAVAVAVVGAETASAEPSFEDRAEVLLSEMEACGFRFVACCVNGKPDGMFIGTAGVRIGAARTTALHVRFNALHDEDEKRLIAYLMRTGRHNLSNEYGYV
jgi:hypothetical protein